VRLNDPEAVRAEYASPDGLEGRRAAYRYAEGTDAVETAFAAVAEVAPRSILEVGSGPGAFAARMSVELGVAVVALDVSARMVELARERGVDARLGDVQALPFDDAAFDCAVAAWMLYHVADVDRALAGLARVLRPGGRLVAVTNDLDHMAELRELAGLPRLRPETPFSARNGAELLGRHFAAVDVREARGTIRFPDRASVEGYVRASARLGFYGDGELAAFATPLVVTRAAVVFVAETAR
jgi:SAM-dependent methyltransferase